MNDSIYKKEHEFDDEIDLKELFLFLWDRKIAISLITSVFAILSILYSLSLHNIYTSSALLVPRNQSEDLSSKLGNLSSLGNLAGFSIPSNTASIGKEAIERIKSFEFFSTYFLPNIELKNMIAISEWNPVDNTIVYDKNIYDTKNNKWIREVSYPLKIIPTPQEAYRHYQSLLSISEDKKTSFVKISIEHQSPQIAKKWLDIIIYQINESMRLVDKQEAQKSIDYLNNLTQTTNFQSIREVIATLLEDQMQVLMLASSNDSYIFKVIDSPIVPEIKSKPSRAIICILGTIVGFFLSLISIFVLFLFRDKKLK